TGAESYDLVLEAGALTKAGRYLDLDRRVLVVTDDGVPEAYVQSVVSACREPLLVRRPQGEASKSLTAFASLLSAMLRSGFTRADCVAAVGGGVVGDLAGFAAASFMRGIDFYNIPTTVLSQADSSVGGKTGVNLDGVKNIAGAFYQPKKVIIDFDALRTLPPRQIANGLAEAVKMAMTSDADLFRFIEEEDPFKHLPHIIENAIRIKKAVVEQDEKERDLRRILNFGHTVGHALESVDHSLLHGECVALGMIPMCGPAARARLLPVLERLGLPTCCDSDSEQVYQAMLHDKKAAGGYISVVRVDSVGSCRIEQAAPETLREAIDMVTKGRTRE
ncbi:MAG: 3-dehydroquinate synthase, partial [Firmicutes bacterium]|nr:3-dehydroquinate synthase [Bacillota bacterium]